MRIPPDLERLSDYVDHWAATQPGREALVLGPLRWTYAELAVQVDRLARALLANGVGRGDRVAIMGTPRPECLTLLLAASRIGAISVGLNPKFPLEELTYFVADSEPRLLIGFGSDSEGDHHATLEALARSCGGLERVVVLDEPGDDWSALLAEGDGVADRELARARSAATRRNPALIVYTSGTTGRPKGAVLPECGLVYCSRIQADRWQVDPLRLLVNLPINHIGFMGDMCAFCIVAGGTAFFMEKFDPLGILELIQRERLTAWGQVPTMFQITAAHPRYHEFDLSSLQGIIWGGARAPSDLLDKLARTGARLATSYGLTETTGSVTYTDREADRDELQNTVGTPDPRYEVRITDPDGAPVAPGEEGEIRVRGDHIMLGYWKQPEATAAAVDADGWLHTGDVAILRSDGRYALRGRLSGMYKSGGENVYPAEVEQVLDQHPGVALSAVFGVADALYGEVGHAYVIREPGRDPDEEGLRDFCRKHLANFKVPKRVFVRDMLPILPIGKIDKMALMREAQGDSSGPAGEPR